MQTKEQLRKSILMLRDGLSSEEHKEKSRFITEHVIAHKAFQSADAYLLFCSFRSEVDTKEIIQYALKKGKPVYLPKVQGKEMEFYRIFSVENLKDGYQGISEPEGDLSTRFVPQSDENIFVLMPGAVLDRKGNRIGYGGGFYDRYLSRLEMEVSAKNLCKMAVGFECQMVDYDIIKKEDHDIRPDYIVTDIGIYTIETMC